ncbi:hypothetical protein L1887_32642 [Cichorium endivia]|nr:hypothetical protein L1887_32642 [Cichorium endivia]
MSHLLMMLVLFNKAALSSDSFPSANVITLFQCPLQPGDTECGYYVLKFMKAVVDEGLQVLNNNQFMS